MHRSLLVYTGILLLASVTLSCHDGHRAGPHHAQPNQPVVVVVQPATTAPQASTATTPQPPNGNSGTGGTSTNVGNTSNLVEGGEEEPIVVFRRKRDDGNLEQNNGKHIPKSAAVRLNVGISSAGAQKKDHHGKHGSQGKFVAENGSELDFELASQGSKKVIEAAGGADVGTSYDGNSKGSASSGDSSEHINKLISSYKGAVVGGLNAHRAVNEHKAGSSADDILKGKNSHEEADKKHLGAVAAVAVHEDSEKYITNNHEQKVQAGIGLGIGKSAQSEANKWKNSGKASETKDIHVGDSGKKAVELSKSGSAGGAAKAGVSFEGKHDSVNKGAGVGLTINEAHKATTVGDKLVEGTKQWGEAASAAVNTKGQAEAGLKVGVLGTQESKWESNKASSHGSHDNTTGKKAVEGGSTLESYIGGDSSEKMTKENKDGKKSHTKGEANFGGSLSLQFGQHDGKNSSLSRAAFGAAAYTSSQQTNKQTSSH